MCDMGYHLDIKRAILRHSESIRKFDRNPGKSSTGIVSFLSSRTVHENTEQFDRVGCNSVYLTQNAQMCSLVIKKTETAESQQGLMCASNTQ